MNTKKELTFPLIGIICNFKGIKEENYLYTPEELKKRDPELAKKCLNADTAGKWFDSEKGTNNKTITGCRLDNRTMLYDFLKGKYNDDTHEYDEEYWEDEWYWENSILDIYGDALFTDTMDQALYEFNQRLDKTTMITISTAHISERTSEWLADQIDHDISNLAVFEKTGVGFFIYIPEYNEENDQEIPEDLRKCIDFARENNAEWLCLDCDGPVLEYDGLHVYEW